MKTSISPWTWTTNRELAAQLVAEGKLSQPQIAAMCGVGVSSLKKWSAAPEFRERVSKLLDEWAEKLAKNGYARKERRIVGRLRNLEIIEQVIAARARLYAVERVKHPKTGKIVTIEIPGGSTGAIVKEFKGGEPVYSFDSAVFAEMRALWQDIAIETGDWKRKIEHSGTVNIASEEEKDLAALLTPDELAVVIARAKAAERP